MSTNLSRRGFMGAAGIAGLTVAGLSSLTACGSGATVSKGGAKASAKLKLPTYVAAQTAPPTLRAMRPDWTPRTCAIRRS